jgi:hypothetical protein
MEMAEQASLVQEGVDRLSGAFESIDHEFQRVQKKITTTRKSVEKRTRKELNRFQKEAKKYPLVKRADSIVNETAKQLESGMGALMKLLQVPSRSDITRIDKRLSALSRRVKEIEKARKANGKTHTL